MMLGAMLLQNTMHAAAEPMVEGAAEGLATRTAEAARAGLRAGEFIELSEPTERTSPSTALRDALNLQDGVIHPKGEMR